MIKHWMAALAFAAACVAAPAWGFDTAPHAQITEQAMTMAGYDRAASDVVQVENWLTDYYTSAPTLPTAQKCMLEKLHFDDVFTDDGVAAYWKTLLRNTLAAAVKAKADNNIIEFYTVLGVSLHVVQDFYAHSNWVESSGFSGQGFDTKTYFQWSAHPWQRTAVVHTGWYANCLDIPQDGHQPHGGYASGLNHDSVVRPNYNRAYVYAVAASYEWIQQIDNAVNAAPGPANFLSEAQNYQPTLVDRVTLDYDQRSSLYISEWIGNPADFATLDGHWNGNLSGYPAAFALVIANWTASPDLIYVTTFKNSGVFQALSRGLYEPYVGPDPQMTLTPFTGTVVDMRVAKACANFGLGTESYFGQLAVAGGGPLSNFPIRDAAQVHLACPNTPWEYLVPVPPSVSSVTMEYSFYDEVGVPSPSQKTVAINGDTNVVFLRCATPPASGGCTMGLGPFNTPVPSTFNGNGFSGAVLSGVSIGVRAASPSTP